MAVTFSEPTTEVSTTSTSSSLALGWFTPSADYLLVVMAIDDSTGTHSIANTGTTLTWTNQVSLSWSSGNARLNIWTAQCPSSTSSSVITVSSTSNWTKACIAILTCTGHNTSSPIVQAVSGTANSTTTIGAGITCSAVNTNNGTIACGGALSLSMFGATWGVDPSGYTKSADILASLSVLGMWYRASGFTDTHAAVLTGSGTYDMVEGFLEIAIASSGFARSFSPGIIG